MRKYILSLDQGTSSSRAILFDKKGHIVAMSSKSFTQIFPKPGWVEHNPLEIWQTQVEVARDVLQVAGTTAQELAAIGIANQRETTVAWDRETGAPICNAVVWQCRRTSSECERLKKSGWEKTIQSKTGLVVDAYFSATKIKWILQNVPNARQMADSGRLLFGTIDSWLLFNLTGRRLHVTDHSNASRTLLYNIQTREWDPELLALFEVPKQVLPTVRDSSEVYAESEKDILGASVPVASCIGDQQSALFGQACFSPGLAKNTYGTGCFLLMNVGTQPVTSQSGLVTTVAWKVGETLEYALEGSVFVAGAAIQWLRDGLGILEDSAQSEQLARQTPDTGGVYFLPAFVGVGAPHWDMNVRGMLCGLTRSTTRAHIVRAALEAIAFQTRDLADCFEKDCGLPLKELRIDGGAAKNDFLCQFQADILGIPVVRSQVTEVTALGAAGLAGLAVGFWRNREEIAEGRAMDARFMPSMGDHDRRKRLTEWRNVIDIARLLAKKG